MRRMKAMMWGLFFTTMAVGLGLWSYHDHKTASALEARGKITTGTVEKSSRTAFEKAGRKRKIQVHYYPVSYDGLSAELRIPGREVPAGTKVQVIYDPSSPEAVQPYREGLADGFSAWDWTWRIVMLLSLVLVAGFNFRDALGPPPPPQGHGA